MFRPESEEKKIIPIALSTCMAKTYTLGMIKLDAQSRCKKKETRTHTVLWRKKGKKYESSLYALHIIILYTKISVSSDGYIQNLYKRWIRALKFYENIFPKARGAITHNRYIMKACYSRIIILQKRENMKICNVWVFRVILCNAYILLYILYELFIHIIRPIL